LGSETYEEARDRIRGFDTTSREESPYLTMGAEVVGSLPTMLIPAATWQRGGSMLRNVGAVGGSSAALGALSGTGYSEGETIQDIASDAATGGTIGGGLGLALGGAGASIGRLSDSLQQGGRIRQWAEGTQGGKAVLRRDAELMSQEADSILARMTPDEMRSADQVGKQVRESYETWNNAQRTNFNNSYDALASEINMSGQTTPTNTQALVGSEAGGAFESSLTKAVRDEIEGGLSVQQLKELRTKVGESTSSGKIGDIDVDTTQARRLYGALSDDLDAAVAQHSNPATANAHQALSADYKQFIEQRGELTELLGTRGGIPWSDTKVGTNLANLYSRDPSKLEALTRLDIDDGVGTGILNQVVHNQGSVDAGRTTIRDNLSNLRYSRSGELTEELAGQGTVQQLGEALELQRMSQDLLDTVSATDASILSRIPFLGAATDAVGTGITTGNFAQILDKPVGTLTNSELRNLLVVLSGGAAAE
jgi:hypothetical protein